jgi:hypothetical protein
LPRHVQACRTASKACPAFRARKRITYDHNYHWPSWDKGTMATLTQVTLTCDVCGKAKDVQTRTIGLDGRTYEIDLCPKDGKGLSKAAASYVSNARKITARQAPRENARRPRSRADTAAIRDWARASGRKISDRGRVPVAVVRDYQAAH